MPVRHACLICDKNFASSSNLKRHLKKLHNNAPTALVDAVDLDSISNDTIKGSSDLDEIYYSTNMMNDDNRQQQQQQQNQQQHFPQEVDMFATDGPTPLSPPPSPSTPPPSAAAAAEPSQTPAYERQNGVVDMPFSPPPPSPPDMCTYMQPVAIFTAQMPVLAQHCPTYSELNDDDDDDEENYHNHQCNKKSRIGDCSSSSTTLIHREPFKQLQCINRPPHYRKHSGAEEMPFTNRPPYISGFQKFYYLKKSLMVILNKASSVKCYMTLGNSLAFWDMKQEDVITLNSITYTLAKRKKLTGNVVYLEASEYNFFTFDAASRVFDVNGTLLSSPLCTMSLLDRMEDIEAKMCLKIVGLVQGMATQSIRALIGVHDMKITKRQPRHGGDGGAAAAGSSIGDAHSMFK